MASPDRYLAETCCDLSYKAMIPVSSQKVRFKSRRDPYWDHLAVYRCRAGGRVGSSASGGAEMECDFSAMGAREFAKKPIDLINLHQFFRGYGNGMHKMGT
jgi:hypothetical protein